MRLRGQSGAIFIDHHLISPGQFCEPNSLRPKIIWIHRIRVFTTKLELGFLFKFSKYNNFIYCWAGIF